MAASSDPLRDTKGRHCKRRGFSGQALKRAKDFAGTLRGTRSTSCSPPISPVLTPLGKTSSSARCARSATALNVQSGAGGNRSGRLKTGLKFLYSELSQLLANEFDAPQAALDIAKKGLAIGPLPADRVEGNETLDHLRIWILKLNEQIAQKK